MKTKQNTTHSAVKVIKSAKHASLLRKIGIEVKKLAICASNTLKNIFYNQENTQSKQ